MYMNGAVSHCVQRKSNKNINEATCYNYNLQRYSCAFNTPTRLFFCGLYKAFVQKRQNLFK